MLAKIGHFCRNGAFLPKRAVSAEMQKGQKETESVSAEFLPKFSAERPPKCSIGRPLKKTNKAADLHLIFYRNCWLL